MPPGLLPPLAVAAAFLVGGVPFSWLLARLVTGVDVRTVGSGNTGATNASRVLGHGWFPLLFALDAAKGAAPVLFLAPWAAAEGRLDLLRVTCGLAAVLGHVFSPFLRFRGGKGVATAAGVMAALAPWAALSALGVFLAVLAAFRYVSLASVAAAVSLVPLSLAFGAAREVTVFTVLVALLVLARHRANLGRIAAGREPRVLERRREPHGG